MHYPEDLDYGGLAKGEPEAHLAILYHAFFEYSNSIHQYLTNLGYSISGKRGNPFLAMVFKIIRESDPSLKLTLKVPQFMSKGFAERKIILTAAILNYVRTNLRNTCPAKASNQSKRDVNFKSENKCKVRELVIPDMSCIKHNDDVTMNFRQDEIPVKEMQSTAVNSVRQQIIRGPNPTMPRKTSQPPPAVGQDMKCTTTMKKNCFMSNARIEHGAMLESVSRAKGAENCVVNTQHKINHDITSTKNLHSEIDELFKRINSLELENQQISLQLKEQKVINKELQKNNEMLKQIVDADHTKFDDITARVKEIESVVNEFRESLSGKRLTSLYSPVCGNDLCKQFRNFRLDSKTPDINGSVFFENSLSDITNESPLHPTHSRSENLFELIRGTRSLLGMDVNTPKASKSDLENDISNLSGDASD